MAVCAWSLAALAVVLLPLPAWLYPPALAVMALLLWRELRRLPGGGPDAVIALGLYPDGLVELDYADGRRQQTSLVRVRQWSWLVVLEFGGNLRWRPLPVLRDAVDRDRFRRLRARLNQYRWGE